MKWLDDYLAEMDKFELGDTGISVLKFYMISGVFFLGMIMILYISRY